MKDPRIVTVRGNAFHLRGDDIDTDRIIPARFLRCITFDGIGEHVFEDDRKQLDGEHPFDNPENKGAKILLVDSNFGCGSSREHAVAAVLGWGIEAIIGRSFAEIFRGNATENGLVCVDVSPEVHQKLIRHLAEPDGEGDNGFEIRLTSLEVVAGNLPAFAYDCTMPSAHRDMLLKGEWDTVATLLLNREAVEDTIRRLPYMQPQAA